MAEDRFYVKGTNALKSEAPLVIFERLMGWGRHERSGRSTRKRWPMTRTTMGTHCDEATPRQLLFKRSKDFFVKKLFLLLAFAAIAAHAADTGRWNGVAGNENVRWDVKEGSCYFHLIEGARYISCTRA